MKTDSDMNSLNINFKNGKNYSRNDPLKDYNKMTNLIKQNKSLIKSNNISLNNDTKIHPKLLTDIFNKNLTKKNSISKCNKF